MALTIPSFTSRLKTEQIGSPCTLTIAEPSISELTADNFLRRSVSSLIFSDNIYFLHIIKCGRIKLLNFILNYKSN
ncbi:MAG: hypothetical protein ACFE8E_01535 [Candidatus Hodarchaeota archaeon]